MATIEDLPNRSILDMSPLELHAHIMSVRSARRVKKKEVVHKATAKKEPKKRSTDELLGMLTDDMIEELMNKIGG